MRSFSLLFLLITFVTAPVFAQTQKQEGKKIFKELDQRRSSVTSQQSKIKMTIFDSNGHKRNRTIRSFSVNKEGNSKSLLIFEEPANVRGTGFLTISKGGNDQQKLYLPALRRIQTISSSQKSDRFMGSDFTYEDLGSQDPDDYKMSLKATTDSAYILKGVKKESSQYDRMLFYIQPNTYALMRVEYFSDQKMIKKLVAQDLEKVNSQLWKPKTMVMYDLKNDRKTTLHWDNREVGTQIAGWRFTDRGLKRGL